VYPLGAGVIVETKEIWDELVPSLEGLSVRLLFELSEVPADSSAFTDRLDRVRPDVVFLDVTNLKEPLEDVVRRIRSVSSQPAVFALHKTAEPQAILTALRAGVSEYLFPPLATHLTAALERLANSRQQARESLKQGGKTIAFVSAKGGCGATTLACHIAADLPSQVKGKVLLADLDLQSGMIGFLLKTKSVYSVADAVGNLQRLDPSYWKALISNGIPNLEIIAAPTSPASKQLSGPQLKQVLAFARTQYDWTVIDLGRNLNASTLSMLDLIDETYLVTTQEIPALHQAKQMIQVLLDSGYPRANLRLVLNRVPKRLEVTLEELEGMLGSKIYATISDDYSTMQEAYAEGRLVDPTSSLGKNFSRLTGKITGIEPPKKKSFSLFG
jgi:pilus assembly protein CpaE